MTRLQKKAAPDVSWENMRPEDLADTLVTVSDPTGAASEAYRMLRTNLFFGVVGIAPKVIVVTSPGPREGKSTTVANLGVTLAQVGKNTLILDCDFRRPMLHGFFGMRNMLGMANILVEERKLHEVWHEPLPRIKVITAGTPPLNPAELVSSQRFAEFVNGMRQEFDYVLIDTPPVSMVSDSVVMATRADGVLLVLDAQGTSKGALRQAVHDLQGVRANLLGTVMNNIALTRSEYTHYNNYTRARG
jgi:capsular exopolysaccharide synthesis family protein